MQINRLSDEVIKEIAPKRAFSLNGYKAVARKAEDEILRQMVEWGEEDCPHLINIMGRKWTCFYCRQELKAGVT